jgi:CTP:molybdopterin cytidylyltransferase MocA
MYTAGIVTGVLLMAGASTAFQKAPQPKLPYKSIDDPEFLAASAAGFLSDGDRLIGIASGPSVKAYPAAILAQHGVVLDQMPDGPIAVTW